MSVSGSHSHSKHGNEALSNIRKPNISPNNNSTADQQAGEEVEDKKGKDIMIAPGDVQLNLQNLLSVDEKFSSLSDCLKKNSMANISQLCSEWWELTDEDDYTVARFHRVYKDEKARREIKQMMSIEILSIAIVNYFTSSPEIFRPTSI